MQISKATHAMIGGILLAGLGGFSASSTLAQQRIPQEGTDVNRSVSGAGMSARDAARQSSLSQTNPLQEFTPGHQVGNFSVAASTRSAVDICAFDVDAQDLKAVRLAILDLLPETSPERRSFLESEKRVSRSCPRETAIFYLSAIARIKNSKGRK